MSETISPNTTIAHYTIVSKIGEGGMGEVYRARDTKLGRDVAIKVLPASLSENADRLNRFEQEAQAAGALNHPNILSIYHIGTHDDAPYIVSELLEGETLRERMAGGALPQRKAIDYALQISKGLAAAHEKGIVHRDIKPGNIFITNDGRVKILDFGLAKLIATDATQSQTEVPTRKANTDPGTVMGTMGYMSPEQLKGQHVDHRTDIFSFGAVLYEMLSGRRAFLGNSTAETISAILREDPKDLSETNKTVSPALERAVRHCLEKNPAERFHSASDLGFALESLSTEYGASQQRPAVASAKVGWSKWPVLLVLSLAFLTIGALGGILIYRYVRQTNPPLYRQLSFFRGTIWKARFAPDGHTIVYSATWNGNPMDLFSLRTDSIESRPFGLANTEVQAVSSTGEMAVLLNRRHLGWFVSSGTLARMSLLGGAPREILEDVQEADFSPDGAQLAVVRFQGGKNRLEYPIGKVLYETDGWISQPRISPQGDRIAFIDHQVQWDDRGWVMVVDAAGKKTRLSDEWAQAEGLAWSPAGDEIWFTASKTGEPCALYATTLSARERLIVRVPINLMLHDISRDGRVLLTRNSFFDNIVGLAPGETKERDLSWLDLGWVTYLSADGRSFLTSYQGEGGGINYSAYLRKTDGSPAVKLGEGVPHGLSPDGKWVLSTLLTPPQIVLLPTGAGEAKRLERGPIEQYGGASWFPDGKYIGFQGREANRGWRYYIQDVGNGLPRAFTPEGTTTGSFYNAGQISPDGKFVVAVDAARKAYIYSVEGDTSPRQVLGFDSGDDIIRWSGDGRSLLVARTGEMPIRVYRLDPSTGKREAMHEITPADLAGIFWPNQIFMTPDGKSYVYRLSRILSDLYVVEGLK